MLSSPLGAPHDVVAAARCPTRCCRRRRPCPTRCCRRRRAPHDVVAAAGAPHDVVVAAVVPHTMLSPSPRCPTRCCRRRRVPHTMLSPSLVPHTMLSQSLDAVRAPHDVVARRSSHAPGCSDRDALAVGFRTPPDSRWLPQIICLLHIFWSGMRCPAAPSRRTRARRTAPTAFRKPAPCVSAS